MHSLTSFSTSLSVYVLYELCLCTHRAVRMLFHFVMQAWVFVCVDPQSRGLLVQSAYLLTCGTIYLSFLIRFDCIPPASVSANSPQCDSVVWHKVMKTHKALITCQWLWGWAVVGLYTHWHTQARRHRWGARSHILYGHTQMHIHTITDAHVSLRRSAVIPLSSGYYWWYLLSWLLYDKLLLAL